MKIKKEIGIICKPVIKGTPNGDAYFIKEFDNKLLVAVIDGEGHGESAAIAANSLIDILERDFKLPLSDIIKNFHVKLKHSGNTRNAVVGLCLISENKLTFCGVGNVDVRVIGEHIHPFSKAGLVGKNITTIVEQTYDCTGKEILIMYSDGISAKFSIKDLPLDKTAQEITEFIDKNYGRGRDDQTVMVVK